MSRPRKDTVVFALPVDIGLSPGDALGMEADAPASAEDSVVALNERLESRPRRLVECRSSVPNAHSLTLPPAPANGQVRFQESTARIESNTGPRIGYGLDVALDEQDR